VIDQRTDEARTEETRPAKSAAYAGLPAGTGW